MPHLYTSWGRGAVYQE